MKNLVIVSFPAKEGMLDDLKETLKVALPDVVKKSKVSKAK